MEALKEIEQRLVDVKDRDREIDVALARLIRGCPLHFLEGLTGDVDPGHLWSRYEGDYIVPSFTYSIDSALTLINENHHLVELRHLNPEKWHAKIGDKIADWQTAEADAATGPLAICLAVVRSAIASQPPV